MKSKAHHKKCVEIGVVPVPTNVEDLAYLSPEGNNALSRVSLKLSPTAGFFLDVFPALEDSEFAGNFRLLEILP